MTSYLFRLSNYGNWGEKITVLVAVVNNYMCFNWGVRWVDTSPVPPLKLCMLNFDDKQAKDSNIRILGWVDKRKKGLYVLKDCSFVKKAKFFQVSNRIVRYYITLFKGTLKVNSLSTKICLSIRITLFTDDHHIDHIPFRLV